MGGLEKWRIELDSLAENVFVAWDCGQDALPYISEHIKRANYWAKNCPKSERRAFKRYLDAQMMHLAEYRDALVKEMQ